MTTIAENYASIVATSCANSIEGASVGVKPMNGRTAFTFPCPFCSPMRSKASKQRSKDAILMPRADKPYCLTFRCMGHKNCQKTYNFQEFLENWNPSLAREYQHQIKSKKQKVYHKDFDRDLNLRDMVTASNTNMKNTFN